MEVLLFNVYILCEVGNLVFNWSQYRAACFEFKQTNLNFSPVAVGNSSNAMLLISIIDDYKTVRYKTE